GGAGWAAASALLGGVLVILAGRWVPRLAGRTSRKWLKEGLHVVSSGLTGTVAVLCSRNWRVLGTWVDLFGSIGALWACLIAVGEHLPFDVVAMGFLIGQFAHAVAIPGGGGAIDAGVTGALVVSERGLSTSSAAGNSLSARARS